MRHSSPAAPRPALPRVVRRNTLLLAGTQAFVGVATQLVPSLGAIIMVSVVGSATLAGLSTSLLNVSRFLAAYPTGWLSDTFGRKAGLYAGLLLSLVGTLGVGVAVATRSFPLLVLCLLVFGLGVGAAQQLRLAAAEMYLPARRGEGLGYVLTGSLVGAVGGPLVMSLAEVLGPRVGLEPMALVWLLLPGVLVPSMGLVTLIRPDPREIAANLERYYPGAVVVSRKRDGDAHATPSGWRTWLANPALRATFVASLGVQGVMTMMMAMTSLALSRHDYALPLISASVSIHVMGMFGLSLPLGRLSDRLGRRAVMLIGLALSGLGSILVPTSPEYGVVTAGTFLVGLGWSGVNVAAAARIADLVHPAERGRAVGVNDAFSTFAAILMPLAGGPLVEWLGMSSLTVLALLVLATPALLLLRLRDQPARERGSAHAPTTPPAASAAS